MKASPQVRSCEKNAACHLRLESIFREHAPRLVGYALHRGATLSEAEDVVSRVNLVGHFPPKIGVDLNGRYRVAA